MAVTVTIKPPLSQITDFNVVQYDTGGAGWALGTYQLYLLADGSQSNVLNYAQWESPLSNMIEIVISQAGKGARLTWTDPANTQRIYLLISRSDGKLGINTSGTPGAWSNGWPVGDQTGDVPTYGIYTNWYATAYSSNFPFGLDNTKGIGQIAVSGDGDVSLATIQSALIADGATVAGADYVDMKNAGIVSTYSLNLDAHASGNLSLTYKFLWLWGGFSNVSSLGGTITATVSAMTPCIISSPRYQGAERYVYLKNTTLDGVIFAPVTYFGSGSGWMQLVIHDATSSITNGVFTGNYPSIDGQEWSKTKFFCSELMSNLTGGEEATDIEVAIGSVRFYSRYSGVTRRFVVAGNLAYDIRAFCNYSQQYTNYVIDCEFSARSDNFPVIYIVNSASYYGYLKVGNTINLKVLNEGNAVIEGATAILKDKNGTQIFSTTTNASGVISEQDVYHTTVRNIKGAASGYIENTNWERSEEFNPYTLEIKKAGYQTYKTKFTLNEAMDQPITLKHSNICVDQEVML